MRLVITKGRYDELRRMALGELPFKSDRLLDAASVADEKQHRSLDPYTRTAVEFYMAARRRSESLKEVA